MSFTLDGKPDSTDNLQNEEVVAYELTPTDDDKNKHAPNGEKLWKAMMNLPDKYDSLV